jgi:hypothetical protein
MSAPRRRRPPAAPSSALPARTPGYRRGRSRRRSGQHDHPSRGIRSSQSLPRAAESADRTRPSSSARSPASTASVQTRNSRAWPAALRSPPHQARLTVTASTLPATDSSTTLSPVGVHQDALRPPNRRLHRQATRQRQDQPRRDPLPQTPSRPPRLPPPARPEQRSNNGLLDIGALSPERPPDPGCCSVSGSRRSRSRRPARLRHEAPTGLWKRVRRRRPLGHRATLASGEGQVADDRGPGQLLAHQLRIAHPEPRRGASVGALLVWETAYRRARFS